MTEQSEKDAYIYGRNAIIEAINSRNNMQKIFVCYGADVQNILKLARKNKINCTTLDKNKFRDLEKRVCPKDAKSQGVIALKQIVETLELHDLLGSINIADNPVVAILDGITDPQNLGAIARSAECAGLKAIILPERNSAMITPVAIKTSAGVLNYFPIVQATNLLLTIEKLKEAGFWIVGTEMLATSNYTDKLYNRPVAIIIGSEGKGMSNSIKKHCDYLVKIPMTGKINSLNASVSAGVIFFEILRQKSSSL